MQKRGSFTEPPNTLYEPRPIKSAPVTPCDSETSTWSEKTWPSTSRHGYNVPNRNPDFAHRPTYLAPSTSQTFQVSTRNYDPLRPEYEPFSSRLSYETLTSRPEYEPSRSIQHSPCEPSSSRQDYDLRSNRPEFGASSSRQDYESDKGYDHEGVWWWHRPLDFRRSQCRRCGASSSMRPLTMVPCSGTTPQELDNARQPLMSRDRPLLFVRQLFL